jgi:hypothetical protein
LNFDDKIASLAYLDLLKAQYYFDKKNYDEGLKALAY